jgi:putative addiction module component (TIGR02574 family)
VGYNDRLDADSGATENRLKLARCASPVDDVVWWHGFQEQRRKEREARLVYNTAMTKPDLTRLALELPIDQRLDLAQTLWDSASPPEDFTLTPELRDLLDARLLEAEQHPETSVTWEDMKARLLRRI